MKPLPHHDAGPLLRAFPRIQGLIEQRNWSAAYEALSVLESAIDDAAPARGEWALLRAQCAVELGHYTEAVDLGRQAYASFQLTSDNERIGLAQSVLGRAYLGLGDTKNARIHSRDALGAYRRLGDVQGMARSYNQLARIHFVRGEYGAAVEHLDDGIDLYRRLSDQAGEARLLGNMGRIHLLVGKWTDAEVVLTKALTCAEDSNNKPSSARNLLSLAFLATLKHDFTTAAERLESALVYIESAELARERSIYHEYAGWWHFGQRHWIQAKEAFRRSLNIGRRLSAENDLVSQSLRGLAECEAALGDWSQCDRLAEEGLAVAIAIGERSEVGSLYRVRARSLAELGQTEEALAHLEKAIECLELVGDPYELARCDVAKAEVLRRVQPEDGETVVDALDSAADRLNRLGATEQLIDVRWMLVDAHQRSGQVDRALEIARRLVDTDSPGTVMDRGPEVLHAIAQRCAERARSTENEFRLGGIALGSGVAGDDDNALTGAIEFYRDRLHASRVVLVEVMADGKRSGAPLVVHGADDRFGNRVAAFAANSYQRHLVVDEPRIYWAVHRIPDLAAALRDDDGQEPRSIISVPIELGPGSTGLLYADLSNDDYESGCDFRSRDIDFAVAFAEIIAWHSTRMRSKGLFRDVQRLRDQLARESDFPSIITQNAEFRTVLSRTRLIVDADVSVLLQGETGTGKDLLAKAIHYSSVRRDHRFVSVNCAALPESLLESELFGARKGAYTGADRDKSGLFEEAGGGTFFLDEIGEMPLSVQVKLLRFLETKELTRLGDTKPRRVDVRVISATNRDLSGEVERGTFRQDLYYRLSPVTFTLPPLRDRTEDIPLLIDHFMAKVREEAGRQVTLSPEVVRVMSSYQWPGNVRELENEIRKIVLLSAPDEEVGVDRLSSKFFEHPEDLATSTSQDIPDDFQLYDHLAQIEQRYIARALAESDGVKKHAAALLGIPESTLRLKMKQHGVRRPR
ncbi:MAG: tetratricopeptide repeat protein [candidate division Zixibacteria bacterium]|nr:tetratricopeptide repeat protein [candidate division Zixibacteria bacterium]